MAARIGAGRRRIEARATIRAQIASSWRAASLDSALVSGGRALAGWLLARRRAIEAAMRADGGLPPGGAAESEALRRFRSYLMLSLAQDAPAAPSLEGVRTGERRMRRLLEAWLAAAAHEAGPESAQLRAALEPFV